MSRGPLVLMYHALGDRTQAQDPHNLFVTLKSFSTQLDLIASTGRTVITLEKYLSGTAGPKDVLLTFDDAYVSTLELGAPELARRGLPATVFASTSTIGGRSEWNPETAEALLGADGLRDLVAHGWTVGAHGRRHDDMRGLPPGRLKEEVVGSRDDLADLLGVAPLAFAYPYGLHDAAARAALQDAGYLVGFAVYDGEAPFATPRVDVNALDTARFFRAKLHPAYPMVRRGLGVMPPVRRGLHLATGVAKR